MLATLLHKDCRDVYDGLDEVDDDSSNVVYIANECPWIYRYERVTAVLDRKCLKYRTLRV